MKIQAYADVLKKASESLQARNKQEEQEVQEKKKPASPVTEITIVRPHSWSPHTFQVIPLSSCACFPAYTRLLRSGANLLWWVIAHAASLLPS